MTTEVREKPILFSGPMVRAILEGRKTQTRRVIKPQPGPTASLHFDGVQWYASGLIADCKGGPWHCPYGEGGDLLWVRESFVSRLNGEAAIYKADLDPVEAAGVGAMYGGWKPSIHMPRRLSRITLKITGRRAELLNKISAEDILAEGSVIRAHQTEHMGSCPVSAFDGCAYPGLKQLWAAGWDSINGKKHPWKSKSDGTEIN